VARPDAVRHIRIDAGGVHVAVNGVVVRGTPTQPVDKELQRAIAASSSTTADSDTLPVTSTLGLVPSASPPCTCCTYATGCRAAAEPAARWPEMRQRRLAISRLLRHYRIHARSTLPRGLRMTIQ